MSDIFSHPATAAADDQQSRHDLHHAVVVPATTDHAWAGLTEHLHLWWPADELSRWGADSFFDLEGNALVETSAQDDENVWGEVIGSQAGEWLEMRWREVGSASSTLIRLDMIAVGESSPHADDVSEPQSNDGAASELRVTHRGWTAEDPQDVHTFYADFWPLALSRYQRFMGGS